VHTPSKLSRRDKLAGPRLFVSPRIFGLLIWVWGTRNHGYSWDSYEGALSMCAYGDGYQTSMMSKDAPGFYSKYDPFLAVFPHANDHTGAGEQLAQ
jgi:hypothetical protein